MEAEPEFMPRPCTMDDDEMDALEQCLEPFFDFIEKVLMNVIRQRAGKGRMKLMIL